MPDAFVETWEFDHSCDLSDVARTAMERLAPPTFSARVLSTRGDALTLQVTVGRPSDDARRLYYVRGCGPFQLARREEWPPFPGGTEKRLLLTLLAFPQPRVCTADPAVR